MNFFSSLMLSIASFFGFGGTAEQIEVVPAPPAEVQVVAESTEVEPVAVMEEPALEPDVSLVEDLVVSDEGVEETADSAAIEMAEDSPMPDTAVVSQNIQTMIVAGGCFWCVEADLEKTPGVIDVVSGYSGGTTENPTYKTYGSGGHREVVKVTYDANQISFEEVLIVTMKTTDPTDDDGTFADRGDKYSSAFYYETDEQRKIIEDLIAEVDKYGPYDKPLAIDVEKRATFWPAEDSHQDYYKGTLTQLKYKYYRTASGRDALIEKYWGVNDHSTELPWRTEQTTSTNQTYMWSNYQKPSEDVLKSQLDDLTYKVTQKEGTERSHSSPLDKNWEEGIYVDVLSGEPLYSSKDKFDSGTGWPSFTKPITPNAVTEHEDKKLFTTRTEIRSAIADNHIGHVFSDGPKDSTGLRYCMNGVALKFIPKDRMEAEGYGDFLQYL